MKGIPVTISPMFWLVAGGLGWLYSGSLNGALIWLFVILLSLLVHEFGHALTARSFGQRAAITILPFGGITQRFGRRLSLFKEFIIVMNGPLAGFLLAGVAYLFLLRLNPETQPMTYSFAFITLRVNIFWTIVNLLPVGPLDGGQLLRILCEAVFGLPGVRFAHVMGIIAGVAIGVLFLLYGFIIGAALFFILAFESGRAWGQTREMTAADTDEGLQKNYQQALELEQQGCFSAAIDRFRQVRVEAGSGVIGRASAQAEAALLAREGREDEALMLLERYRSKLAEEGLQLYQQLAYSAGRFQEALEAGIKVFDENPQLSVAVLNAKSSAQLGDGRQAAGWLESAKREGLDAFSVLIGEKDFDLVRDHPRIKKLIKSF